MKSLILKFKRGRLDVCPLNATFQQQSVVDFSVNNFLKEIFAKVASHNAARKYVAVMLDTAVKQRLTRLSLHLELCVDTSSANQNHHLLKRKDKGRLFI